MKEYCLDKMGISISMVPIVISDQANKREKITKNS